MSNRKDIFLDFICPDNWKTNITFFSGKSQTEIVSILCRSLNYSAFLTKSVCYIPPAFIMQSKLVRKALVRKEEYLKQNLFLMPLKERAIEEYLEKKRKEYRYVKDSHAGYYEEDNVALILKNIQAIVPRELSMGMNISENWSSAHTDEKIWGSIEQETKVADKIRLVPNRLKENGFSITLEAIRKYLGKDYNRSFNLDFSVNQAIQHEYFKAYLKEYDCVIINDIPPKPYKLNNHVGISSLFYNYYVVLELFKIFKIDYVIENASPKLILDIRKTSQYWEFIDRIYLLCNICKDREEVIRRASLFKKQLVGYPNPLSFFEKHSTTRQFDYLSEVLYTISDSDIDEVFNIDYLKRRRSIMPKLQTKIFIVHGHDNEAKQETARFLENLGINAIILHEQPDKGKTIIEKLEEYTDVDFAIILYTPCDEGKSKKDITYHDRARQNVVFEHGYLVSKLGREKVCALVKNDTEQPGDLSGVIYKKMDSAGAWKMEVAKAIKASGYNIDLNKL